ncbi:MAG: hypothetical protein HYY48_10205 [Gammaproteobacteria bacterium]|nr:hypothetical protein [Gammaproteobacteria bacterium]
MVSTSESFPPVRRLGLRDPQILRLVTHYQGRKLPTVGGFLLAIFNSAADLAYYDSSRHSPCRMER